MQLVNQQFFSEKDTRAGLRFADVPSSSVRLLPSARRGHTISVIDGFFYLFGGFSPGYPCKRAHKAECIDGKGVSNELWRFDPKTNIWLEIKPVAGLSPPAREKHSAIVLSGRLLVFGGKGNDEDDAKASMNGTFYRFSTAPKSPYL